jgi:hypothetical protein
MPLVVRCFLSSKPECNKFTYVAVPHIRAPRNTGRVALRRRQHLLDFTFSFYTTILLQPQTTGTLVYSPARIYYSSISGLRSGAAIAPLFEARESTLSFEATAWTKYLLGKCVLRQYGAVAASRRWYPALVFAARFLSA